MAEMEIKGLAPWFGSKRMLAPTIVAQLGLHQAYWEPFAGSMSVLLAKPAATMENVNDLHGDLVNLARVVKDAEIGQSLNMPAHRVSRWRRNEGLRNNRGSESSRRKRRQYWADNKDKAKARRKKIWNAQKAKAAAMGWPQADTPRQAQILTFLATGPKTKAQIGDMLGIKPVKHHDSVHGLPVRVFVISTLMRLIRKGVVQNVGLAGGRGKQSRTSLFGLADEQIRSMEATA